MSDVVVWSAGMVIPITAPSILDGAVAVRDGRIEHVGARDWVVETLTQRGLSFTERHFDGVLLPGLVNAHTHLQYTGMASVGAGQYRGFDDWARAFDEVYDAGGLDWGGDAAAGARLLLESGTTAAADVVTDAAAASALHDAGLHGVTYWEVMSWSNEEWRARGEREVSASLDAMPTPPAVGISPHAPYSLDAEPLLDLPDMARRRGMRIHIHLGESHSEAEWSETRTTALADLWKSEHSSSFTAMRSRGGGFSSTQFVDQLGVLGPDCHVAHGVYMRADDRRRLRARQTAVALCPRSNRVIGLDAPPVAAYLTEMRGVLGGALPQAPTFSDHVAALPQESSPAPAPEPPSTESAESAEPAASGSAGSPRSAASGSASSAPSATSAAPAPAANKAAAASGSGQQPAPKNAQKGGPARIEHVPAPGKSSNASGNSTNRNPRQGKGRR